MRNDRDKTAQAMHDLGDTLQVSCAPFAKSSAVQAKQYIEQEDDTRYKVNIGFVPKMRVPGYFYVNDRLKSLIFEELQHACQRGGHGGFLPAVQQLANVAGLPGIVKVNK